MCVPCRENAGILGPLSLRRHSCVSFVAGHDIVAIGRVPVGLAKALLVDETSPLDLSLRKDRAPFADRLPDIARSGLHPVDPRYAFLGVHPACVCVLTMPVWAPLGAARPAAKMPGLPRKTDASCTSRSAVKKFPRLERNRIDLRRRSRSAARS